MTARSAIGSAKPMAAFVGNSSSDINVPNTWHIVGTGDFNGDGIDDILWRNDNGT